MSNIHPLLSVSMPPPTTAGTYYRPLCDNAAPAFGANWQTTAAGSWQPVAVAAGLTLSIFGVNCQTNPASKYTFTVMKLSGGTVTSTALTLTPSTTQQFDTTHSATFAQGDCYCMQVVVASGASSTGGLSWYNRVTTSSGSVQVSGGIGPGAAGGWPLNTAPNWGSLQGCAGNGTGVGAPSEVWSPPGTIKNFAIYLPTSVAAGSWQVVLDRNGSSSGVGPTITSGNYAIDNTNTVHLSAGDISTRSRFERSNGLSSPIRRKL